MVPPVLEESQSRYTGENNHQPADNLKPSLAAMKITSEAGKETARNSDNVATTTVPVGNDQ